MLKGRQNVVLTNEGWRGGWEEKRGKGTVLYDG